MGSAVVIGLQYGDEGKGRVTGFFANDYEWAVRFNGGPNAGHTVYDTAGKQHKLHHLPAGSVFGKNVALDTGMVINVDDLMEERKKIDSFPLYIQECSCDYKRAYL
jgi:adenylosuccinate synthase